MTVGGKIKYKLVLLGDQHVGKSSIIDRFINDKFEESYNVYSIQFRLPSASTSLSEILFMIIRPTDYNCGILQVRKDLEL